MRVYSFEVFARRSIYKSYQVGVFGSICNSYHVGVFAKVIMWELVVFGICSYLMSADGCFWWVVLMLPILAFCLFNTRLFFALWTIQNNRFPQKSNGVCCFITQCNWYFVEYASLSRVVFLSYVVYVPLSASRRASRLILILVLYMFGEKNWCVEVFVRRKAYIRLMQRKPALAECCILLRLLFSKTSKLLIVLNFIHCKEG